MTQASYVGVRNYRPLPQRAAFAIACADRGIHCARLYRYLDDFRKEVYNSQIFLIALQ